MEAWGQGWIGLLAAILFGLSVGSFANVAIYRLPLENLSVWRPARSMCPACRAPIGWWDNIPVVSWLLLRGRCRACQASIAWRYPAVELLTAGLFVLTWWLAPPADTAGLVQLGVVWYLAAACVVISAIDLEYTIIPDAVTLPGIALGLALSLAFPDLHAAHAGFRPEQPHGSSLVVALLGLLAGGGSLWLVGRLGNVMLRQKVAEAGIEDAMGMGDVKWMAFAGTLLGPGLVLEAILAACFVGALVGIVLKLVARARGSVAPIGLPFGPFLSFGILLELAHPGLVFGALGRIGG